MSKYSNKIFEGFDELENSMLIGEDELETGNYKSFDHINDVWDYLEDSKSERDLKDRINDVDPHKFGSVYYDLHEDGRGATVVIDYSDDNEDYYEKVDVYFDELEEAENNLVGKKFRCIKGIYHPNMGILIRKGKVVNVDEDKGNEVVLNGITLYKKFLDTHFEPVVSEEK